MEIILPEINEPCYSCTQWLWDDNECYIVEPGIEVIYQKKGRCVFKDVGDFREKTLEDVLGEDNAIWQNE